VSAGKPALSAFTVDVEDWYQSCVDFDAPISERVVRNIDRVLETLEEFGVKATFFVQGRVAETFPGLLRAMVAEGHEIQSHGYSHRPLFAMSHDALRRELKRSRETVEDACGCQVTAFRAPDFSIGQPNLWALDVLAETGFEVDSSIFPIKTWRYGVSDWYLGPQQLVLASGASLLEVPVAVWQAGPVRVPVAGGGYFRLLPRPIVERGLRSIMASGRPVIVYCHPYEFSAGELDDYRRAVRLRTRLVHGLGRGQLVRRLRALLERLPFGRLDEVLTAWGVK
jgi:polysaccharide deacetylase family protein (PEP-CTERM system associated)